jgi:Replication-relaxation
MAPLTLSLTDTAALGLYFIHRYRFLTIEQYARAAGVSRDAASDRLREMERHGFLGHFGNVGIKGYGKVPKAYFLTRKGYELLTRETDIPAELFEPHKDTHVATRWSPKMYHRLRTIDLMIAAEVEIRKRPHLSIVKTFTEYRQVRRGNRVARETSDFVEATETPENRIVPDAGFILENVETGRRGLFFIEMDMATERIITQITQDRRLTVRHKLEQYDRYLTGGRFAQTYAPYGEFRSFSLLFVSLGWERIDNIRAQAGDLPSELAGYYRFTTYAEAMANFLGPIWKSRALSDTQTYPLVREPKAAAG